jgi:hypothetical protein
MDAEAITLPGGFERDETWQRIVWLRPLTGRDELLIADPPGPGGQAARVTALLARTMLVDYDGPAVGPDHARALTIGDREAALLHLRRITLDDGMSCVLTCPGCHAKLDLDVRASDLLLPPYPHAQRRHRTTIENRGETFEVSFRLPTGDDQERVAALAAHDPIAAATTVLDRCIDEVVEANGRRVDTWPDALGEHVARVMAELDPQAEVELDATCPACAEQFVVPFDTAQFLVHELALPDRDVCREVHQLARRYHWAESEILGMTRRRRRRYLELLAEVGLS